MTAAAFPILPAEFFDYFHQLFRGFATLFRQKEQRASQSDALSRAKRWIFPMTIQDESDERLLARARAGDAFAFADLCERNRRRVWRVVSTVTRSGSEAEDLAQEAIVRAWSAFRNYRGEAAFETWLCRIALNAAHDYQRSAWKRRVWLFGGRPSSDSESDIAPPEGQIAPGPHQDAERREAQRRIRAAVAQLNEAERTPIWMIYFEEFSLAEVARLENLPESTVRSRVKAGLKRLGRALDDLKPDDLNSEGLDVMNTTRKYDSGDRNGGETSLVAPGWRECHVRKECKI